MLYKPQEEKVEHMAAASNKTSTHDVDGQFLLNWVANFELFPFSLKTQIVTIIDRGDRRQKIAEALRHMEISTETRNVSFVYVFFLIFFSRLSLRWSSMQWNIAGKAKPQE